MRRSAQFLAVLFLAHSVALAPAYAGRTAVDTLELRLYGRKYPVLPFENRLMRLEKTLRSPTPKIGVSEDMRLAQLNQVHIAYVSEGARQNAVKLYNQAVDEAARRNTDVAVSLYRKALAQNPAFLEASNNLATLLGEQKLFAEAEKVYLDAQKHFPNEAVLYRNLGVIYERTGKVQEALKQYRQYLALSVNPDPPIRAIVENYQATRTTTADYVASARDATQGRELLWPRRMVPISVFVELTEPMHAMFLQDIRDAFAQWEQATNGRLRFQEVATVPEAGIYISFKPGPLMNSAGDVGHASFNMPESHSEKPESLKINITLNTGTVGDGLPAEQRKEQIARLALHELGHAIGIWGHSSNPGDVMYTRPIVSELSSRDLLTIRKLYDLTP